MFSAVVGGVDTYENEPYDETVRKGDEFSRRIARNAHIILQEEFGMLRPIDPAGGSWALEHLTKEMAEKSGRNSRKSNPWADSRRLS